jgi:urease beta subunit
MAVWSRPPIPKSVVPAEAFPCGEPGKCGAIDFAEGDIKINAGRRTVELVMVNTGDRPVQIGAHYHIAECNMAMAFDTNAQTTHERSSATGGSLQFCRLRPLSTGADSGPWDKPVSIAPFSWALGSNGRGARAHIVRGMVLGAVAALFRSTGSCRPACCPSD